MSINNTNAKTAAAIAPTMVAALVAAKARKAAAKAEIASQLRQQLEEAVGKDHSIPRLEALRVEARDAMEEEELQAFEAGLDALIEVRKDLEKTEAEAKRLKSVSTTQGMEAHLDRKVEAEEEEKARKALAKAKEAKAKAHAAAEERITRIIADLGDITPGQRGAVMAFLRGNPQWNFIPTEGGRRSLVSAAGRAAAEFNKANKVKANEAKVAQAAQAPLTHKVKLNK